MCNKHTLKCAEATLLCVRLTARLLSVRSRKRLTSQSKCKKKRGRDTKKKIQRQKGTEGKGIIRKGQGQKRNSLREQEQCVPIKQATIILFQFY
jgi:hypothetical protein